MREYSIVPDKYKGKDPRALLYHFPSMPVVKYAKILQEYHFYQMLEVAEDMAHKMGFILIPYACMHWQRKKEFAKDRKVKIGRNSFFMMKIKELTDSEKNKFMDYLDELGQKKIS